MDRGPSAPLRDPGTTLWRERPAYCRQSIRTLILHQSGELKIPSPSPPTLFPLKSCNPARFLKAYLDAYLDCIVSRRRRNHP